MYLHYSLQKKASRQVMKTKPFKINDKLTNIVIILRKIDNIVTKCNMLIKN